MIDGLQFMIILSRWATVDTLIRLDFMFIL